MRRARCLTVERFLKDFAQVAGRMSARKMVGCFEGGLVEGATSDPGRK
jgi:hypothetical protein